MMVLSMPIVLRRWFYVLCTLCLVAVWPLSGAMGAQPPTSLPPTVKNTVGIEFVLIPAGTFTMGSLETDAQAYADETPQHPVEISRPFYLSRYEVTRGQWLAVMQGSLREHPGEPSQPVTHVSWHEVQAFIQRLNTIEPGATYRLPTEAEWEYAARAGTTTRWSFGDDAEPLHLYSWYEKNARGTAHRVGQLKPNPWGLYDMHGNVWEWVQDRYGRTYYQSSPVRDPQGPAEGKYRVFRGGGWSGIARYCRSAPRRYASPGFRHATIGFRILREIVTPRP